MSKKRTKGQKRRFDKQNAIKNGLGREDYIAWLEAVILGEEKFEQATSKGSIETLEADSRTKIVYGKELTKLRGWYDQEEHVEEAQKVVVYLPENGRVAG